jgi:hypothetical protein
VYSLDLLFLLQHYARHTVRVDDAFVIRLPWLVGLLAIESLAAEAPPTVRWMFLYLWEGLSALASCFALPPASMQS